MEMEEMIKKIYEQPLQFYSVNNQHMNINLSNGYFSVTRSKNQFKADLKAANNKVLSSTERMHNKKDVISNIISNVRACNGTGAVIVDHTDDSNMYFIQADGTVINPDGSAIEFRPDIVQPNNTDVQNTGNTQADGQNS